MAKIRVDRRFLGHLPVVLFIKHGIPNIPADQQAVHPHGDSKICLVDIALNNPVDLFSYRIQPEQTDCHKNKHHSKCTCRCHEQAGTDSEFPKIKHVRLP